MVMVRQAEWHDHRAACASAHSHGAHATATVACGNGGKNSPKCRVPTPTMWASETAGSTVRSRCAHPLGNENLYKKPGLKKPPADTERVCRACLCARGERIASSEYLQTHPSMQAQGKTRRSTPGLLTAQTNRCRRCQAEYSGIHTRQSVHDGASAALEGVAYVRACSDVGCDGVRASILCTNSVT